jgi:hypothetical protein
MAGVMATAIPGSAWYVSITAYAQTLCRLAAVSGGLTAMMLPDGRVTANYLGFPVRFSGKMPDVSTTLAGKMMLAFGDLSMSRCPVYLLSAGSKPFLQSVGTAPWTSIKFWSAESNASTSSTTRPVMRARAGRSQC